MARVFKTLRERRSRDYAVNRNLFYHKSCVNLLWFQNVYRPNRRPYPSVFDLKEKSTRYVGFSTRETDLVDRHDHRTEQNKYITTPIRRKRIPLNLE